MEASLILSMEVEIRVSSTKIENAHLDQEMGRPLMGRWRGHFFSGEHVLRGLHSEVQEYLGLYNGNVWTQI